MHSFSISVIIPVFKDWTRLVLCLDALEAQKNTNSSFEVIVVNNDPGDSFIPSPTYTFPIKFLKEPVPGSYSARNRGLSQATGDAFLFTDSDCIPAPDWISVASKLLEENTADLFAGSIALFSQVDNKYVRLEKAFAFPNSTYVSKYNFGVTANLLVKKEVVESIGAFNAGLFTGGDSEFCNRAFNAGFKINYCPTLKVNHPARSSWEELKVRAIRFGGRLPTKGNSFIVTLKLLGKFRIHWKDISEIYQLKEVSFSDKLDFFVIRQKLRWVEAKESFSVFFGKNPGRK
ncbi:glycosyltransferase [Algoriphagus sp. D3-2-R+10]|uniref:glycosyltransferase family 2 protein n=1 Tax=Algoriphagus aurantiacus TaxID=3103948 RepID=UPI002B36BC94|nr:glycosyltransferase [Algoriphagus sp. D3-2-R+10]MEB2777509.1 glycosyltransferase [Algoriphagus sp. D3-2-R+10]